MKKLPESFWAYLAGFIEGDGCIYLGEDKDNYPVHRVMIIQKNLDFVQFIKNQLTHGSIQQKNDGVNNLIFGPKISRYICQKIAPYMLMERKKEKVIFIASYQPKTYGAKINNWNYSIKPYPQELFWPYLAGVFDSDGTLGIYKQKASNNKYYMCPRGSISQDDKNYLQSIQSKLNVGSVCKRGKTSIGRQMYYLTFGPKVLKDICIKMLPYLIIQKANANKIISKKHKIRTDSACHSDDALQAREMYLNNINIATISQILNRKPSTVNYWLRKQGITRSLSESQKLRRAREHQT